MALFSRHSSSTLKSAVLLACVLVTATANAQWQILDSHTAADLRGRNEHRQRKYLEAVRNAAGWLPLRCRL
jgi:hypothetical protein